MSAESSGAVTLRILGMHCGSCARTVEEGVRQLPGVRGVSVSFATERLQVEGSCVAAEVEARVRELGFEVAGAEGGASVEPQDTSSAAGPSGFFAFLRGQPDLFGATIVAGGLLVGVLLLRLLGVDSILGMRATSGLFGLGVVVVGLPVAAKGIRALVFAHRVTIDLLMSIAAAGALAIGETGEAVTVLLLFTLGEALEAFSAERARDSLRSLLSLQPRSATLLETENDGTVRTALRDVDRIAVGDRILVRAGERVPLDGVIERGVSSFDQSPVTGESEPAAREVGEEVMAGTVNVEAAVEVRVTRPADRGTIARIARLVEQAQARRSPAERFVDRFARYYTPAVVTLAVVVVLIPVVAFGAPLLDGSDGGRGWLYRGLALLIVACPCALVISIPVTVVSALTGLARAGILVRSGALLDRLADVRVVAFDKTGTLTHGRPVVTSARGVGCTHDSERYAACAPCDGVIADAASIERASAHPVARAIVDAADGAGQGGRVARDVVVHTGRGVSGTAACGHEVAVGNHRLFREEQEGWSDVAPLAAHAEAEGQTVTYVSHDGRMVGYIGVCDEVRRASAGALAALASLRPQVRAVMLTGDHERAARRVAQDVDGIDDVRSGLLPEDKLEQIETLGRAGEAVAMVGDGVNDAPALARADIGIAMGAGGTAQAMETADVVLMQDDLSHVPLALEAARRTRRVVKQNVVASLGLKLAFVGLAVTGVATLWMAVVADVGATVLVTLNGMRMLRPFRG